MLVAAPSLSAAAEEELHPVRHEIHDQLAGLGVADLGADGEFDLDPFAFAAVLIADRMGPARSLVVVEEGEVVERAAMAIGDESDIAAATAVGSVRTAARDVLLAVEADGARTALTGCELDGSLVEEHRSSVPAGTFASIMFLPFLLGCAAPARFDVAAFDALARVRDVAGMERFLVGQAPLSVLKTNGAYETGKYGWRALGDPQGRYVVLSTRLTSQDIGELLFEVTSAGKLRYMPESDARGLRFGRHRMSLSFVLGRKLARIRDDVTIVGANGGDAFFRLGPNYRVTRLLRGGNALRFRQIGGVIVLPPNAAGRLRIEYEGVVDSPRYAGSLDADHIQLTNDLWYPTIARRPAPYDLSAAIPRAWTAVGSGERQSSRGAVRFRMDLPTTWWSFSAEPFRALARRDRDGREYRVWSRRLTPERMRIQSELYPPILAFYGRFGKFPFSGYGAADVATYGSGALEAYSFATYGEGFLPDEDAHEPAHTWFGGLAGNDYLTSLWSESFASYAEGLFDRESPIGDRAARDAAFTDLALPDRAYERYSLAEGSPFIGPDSAALGYGKGAHVLAMLEELIGTERMIGTIRTWLAGRKAGDIASWEEFAAAAERANPTFGLKSFFDDWVFRPGVATLSVSDVSWREGEVRGRFGPGVRRMPVEFAFEYGDGRFEYRMLDTGNLSSDGAFSLRTGYGKPARVLVDPRHRALRTGAAAPPTGVAEVAANWPAYRDPKTPAYLKFGGKLLSALPPDLNGVVIVGRPESTPAMRPLLERVGMRVVGDSLVWRGTRVDLRRAGAMALVPLPKGGAVAMVLGTAALEPNLGRAEVALFDRYGRFLAGESPLPRPSDGVFEIP